MKQLPTKQTQENHCALDYNILCEPHPHYGMALRYCPTLTLIPFLGKQAIPNLEN